MLSVARRSVREEFAYYYHVLMSSFNQLKNAIVDPGEIQGLILNTVSVAISNFYRSIEGQQMMQKEFVKQMNQLLQRNEFEKIVSKHLLHNQGFLPPLVNHMQVAVATEI